MQRKNGHLRLIALTYLVLLLILTACGESTPTAATTAATTVEATKTPKVGQNAANPVTIKWSYWGDDAEIEIIKKLIAQFERLNPGIKVNTIYEKWETYFDRVGKEWLGDDSPDVMFLSYISTYASLGILEPIDSYVSNEPGFRLDDFYPSLLEIFKYNNALYGLPRDNATKVVYVNLKLLQEAGVAVPKAGWTWNDLREASLKLTKRDASGKITQYGYAYEPNEYWRLWAWQNGGEIFDDFKAPDPPQKLLMNSPATIEGIQFFADLTNKDKVTPSFEEMSTSQNITKMFQDGKVAMVFGGHGKVPAFSNTKGLSWDVVPLPMGKKRVNVSGGAGYVIHKNSKHKAEAWELVKFLSSDFGQGLFMETGILVPARQSIREDNIYVQNSKFSWQVFNEESKYGRQTPQFRSFNVISKDIDKELEPVWKGQKSAAEVLTGLPNIINPQLAALK